MCTQCQKLAQLNVAVVSSVAIICCSFVLAGVKRAWGSYEELAKDGEVDIVYVSNVHPAHKDTTLLMLGHGKHVLCEKPIAVRAQLRTIKFNPKKKKSQQVVQDPPDFAEVW